MTGIEQRFFGCPSRNLATVPNAVSRLESATVELGKKYDTIIPCKWVRWRRGLLYGSLFIFCSFLLFYLS